MTPSHGSSISVANGTEDWTNRYQAGAVLAASHGSAAERGAHVAPNTMVSTIPGHSDGEHESDDDDRPWPPPASSCRRPHPSDVHVTSWSPGRPCRAWRGVHAQLLAGAFVSVRQRPIPAHPRARPDHSAGYQVRAMRASRAYKPVPRAAWLLENAVLGGRDRRRCRARWAGPDPVRVDRDRRRSADHADRGRRTRPRQGARDGVSGRPPDRRARPSHRRSRYRRHRRAIMYRATRNVTAAPALPVVSANKASLYRRRDEPAA